MSTFTLRERIAILFGATPQSLEESRIALKEASTQRVKMLVTKASVNALFRRSFFSICEVDDLMALHNVVLCEETAEAYRALKTLHCVHYENMPRELVNALPALVMGIVFPDQVLEKEVPQQRPLAIVKTLTKE